MIKIEEDFVKAIISNPLSDSLYRKIDVKKISLKEKIIYQASCYTKEQVFHENLSFDKLKDFFEEKFLNFKQLEIWTLEKHSIYLRNKKGTVTEKIKNFSEKTSEDINHDRKKEYLLLEGTKVLPLTDLHIFDEDGNIIKRNYSKYRQINRFLEFVDDLIKDEKEINIVDFGCGSSYLTFLVYYYLTEVKKIKVKMTGLDLKEEVVQKCLKLRDKYQYHNLDFKCLDIKDYQPEGKIDMLISLHACDTATDYCLYQAIKLNIKYLLSVPCCHKEINEQIKNEDFKVFLRHGLIKNRFSSLITDLIRERILNYYGYKTNILEFIGFEETPKNVLLRGEKSDKKNEAALTEVLDLIRQFNLRPTLLDLLHLV